MISSAGVTNTSAAGKVRDAVIELAFRFPLAGLTCLGEAIVILEQESVGTLATDGRHIFYAPSWVNSITSRALVFDLLHEWLHIFDNHPLRCAGRDKELWNIACDMKVVQEAINILSVDGTVWTAPKDGVQPQPWAVGMCAEEIYDCFMKNQKLIPPPPKHLSNDIDWSRSAEKANAPQFEEKFYQTFVNELTQAQLIMDETKAKCAGILAKRVQKLSRGTIPWGRLIYGNIMDQFGGDILSYSPPNRKYYPDLIMPKLRSTKTRKLLLGFDVSASVTNRMHQEFVLNVMPAALKASVVIVVTFDVEIREVVVTRNPRTLLDSLHFQPGPHNTTDVRPLFKLVDEEKPASTAIMTDGFLHYPDKPYESTVWAIPTGGHRPPWGTIYEMDMTW